MAEGVCPPKSNLIFSFANELGKDAGHRPPDMDGLGLMPRSSGGITRFTACRYLRRDSGTIAPSCTAMGDRWLPYHKRMSQWPAGPRRSPGSCAYVPSPPLVRRTWRLQAALLRKFSACSFLLVIGEILYEQDRSAAPNCYSYPPCWRPADRPIRSSHR
jgi:hypothetical protein